MTAAEVAGQAPTASSDALPEAAERGGLTIADRVVERVAGHAVTLVDGAGAAPRRLLGVRVGEAQSGDEASVQARVEGRTATVEATVAVAWPRPVRAVVRELRARVREEVLRLTGVEVAQIDVDVVSLTVPRAPRRRVQ